MISGSWYSQENNPSTRRVRLYMMFGSIIFYIKRTSPSLLINKTEATDNDLLHAIYFTGNIVQREMIIKEKSITTQKILKISNFL